mgnify:FL=1
MRLPGWLASPDDSDRGHGQRPYGRRCGDSCTASANAQQVGSGALITSTQVTITTGPLVAGVVTEVASYSFSALAGDVILAWSNPSMSGAATSIQAEIRLDDVVVAANLYGAGNPGTGLPVIQRLVVPSTGTHTVDLYLTAIGGAATVGAGFLVVAQYRSPPL